MTVDRIICILIGYAIGLFQTGYIYGKTQHIDLREHGSGNAGTTNTLRTLGFKAGAITFAGDCGKAILAIFISWLIFHECRCMSSAACWASQKRWPSGRRDWPTSRERWLCSSSVWFSASSTGRMPCSGWPRLCPATTTRTASATLHRVRSTSTSRASITTTETGSTSCGRSGSGRWCRWCWCRPARRGQFSLSVPPAGRCGARCWWRISPRCSGRS